MEVPFKAKVIATDGECGITTTIIIHPEEEQLTHLVVKAKIDNQEYLVPLSAITTATRDEVQLNCAKNRLISFAPFKQAEFVETSRTRTDSDPWMSHPYVYTDSSVAKVGSTERVPTGQTAVRRGTKVYTTDGHAGVVDGLIVQKEDGHITHFLLQEGHLWGKKDVTVPLDAIERTEDEAVYLKLTHNEVEQLPTQKIARWWK